MNKELQFPVLTVNNNELITILNKNGLAKTTKDKTESYGIFLDDIWVEKFTLNNKENGEQTFSGCVITSEKNIKIYDVFFSKIFWKLHKRSFERELKKLEKREADETAKSKMFPITLETPYNSKITIVDENGLAHEFVSLNGKAVLENNNYDLYKNLAKELSILADDFIVMIESYGLYENDKWMAKFTKANISSNKKPNNSQTLFHGTQIGRNGLEYNNDNKFSEKWWKEHKKMYDKALSEIPNNSSFINWLSKIANSKNRLIKERTY